MTASVLRQLPRHPHDPTLRLKAVQALAEMDHVDHAPYLIRAAVEARPRCARARQALLDRVGAEQTAPSRPTSWPAPDEDPWLVEQAEEDEADLSFEDDQYLAGLITVLRNHPDAQMRLKAIAEMKQNSDMRVIAALAETCCGRMIQRYARRHANRWRRALARKRRMVSQSYQVQDYLEQQEEDEEDEGEWEDGPEENRDEQSSSRAGRGALACANRQPCFRIPGGSG